MEGYVQIVREFTLHDDDQSISKRWAEWKAEADGARAYHHAAAMQFLIGTPIPEDLKRFAPTGTCSCGCCLRNHADTEVWAQEDPAL